MSTSTVRRLAWRTFWKGDDLQGEAEVLDGLRRWNGDYRTIEVYKVPNAGELAKAFDLRPPYDVKDLRQLAEEVVAFGACAARLGYRVTPELWTTCPKGALPGILLFDDRENENVVCDEHGADCPDRKRPRTAEEVEDRELRDRHYERELVKALLSVFGGTVALAQEKAFGWSG